MGTKKLRALVAKLTALGDEPPKEFRIFRAGENFTTKDERPFIFDEASAALLMAEYAAHGVDIAIDREHLSLDQESANYDPDARGWCNLEVRNGELWAVNVRWTPDGLERLRNKTQRYISPVFTYAKESLQILSLYNIAICAIPATYEAPPLVAASKRSGKKLGTLSVEAKKMDALKAVCKALGLKDESTLDEALAAIKAMQEPDGDEEKAADDPDKKDKDEKEEAAADDPEDKEKMAAALNRLPPKIRGAVMAAVVHTKTMAKDIAELKAKQAASEVEALIASNTNKIPLALESWARTQPVAALRAFIAAAPEQPRPATPPAGGGGNASDEVKLTDEDKAMAKLAKIPEDKFLATKKARHAAEQARA